MRKRDRQNKLIELIRTKDISNQLELKKALESAGIHTNQASISRDLNELGIAKIRGFYRLPRIDPGESAFVDLFDINVAGDHLIVINTSPGKASALGLSIDGLNLDGVVGSVAGDDSLFIAVKDKKAQSNAMKHILTQFRPK